MVPLCSARFDPCTPLHLNLRLSPKLPSCLTTILVVMHMACIITIGFLAIGLWLKWVAVLLLGVSATFYVRQQFKFESRAVSLELSRDNKCLIKRRSGKIDEYCVLGDSYLSSWFIILNLKSSENRTRDYLIICSNMLDLSQWQQLIVWLRWEWARAP